MAGDCYAAAGRALMDAALGGLDGSLVVVHGRPTLQVPPFVPYGHAWLERAVDLGGFELVICEDAETGVQLPRELYYQLGRINPEECFRYDWAALRRWIKETGHWGPWEGPDACGPIEGREEGEER